MTILSGARLLPTGEPVDITMADGVITAVGPVTEHPDTNDVVDVTGRYVSPGFIDTHLHLLDESELETLTTYGVTGAVELGTHPDSLITRLHDAPGVTRFLSAGCAASAPGGTQTTVIGFPLESAVTGPDDAERFVAWRADAGSDLIKIIIEDPHNPTAKALDQETITALVEAAHRHGMLTVAHVVTAHSFTMGLDADVDVLTHAPLDRPLDEETITRMRDAGTIASPTLIMMQTVAQALASRPGPGPELSFDNALESVRRLHAAGVPVITGTDANLHPKTPAQIPPGTSLHDELELLVQAGLTPTEVLTAATSAAASAMRLEGRGVVEPGAVADLVVLTDDPRGDIAASRSIDQVWINGERVR